MLEQDRLTDIFTTMSRRYRGQDARPDLAAAIGFDLGEAKWTVAVAGSRCTVQPGLKEAPTALVRTSPQEWQGLATGALDPAASFVAKRLTVDGDLTVLLEVFNLFDPYVSADLEVKEPSWVLETLGPHFSVNENGHFMIEGHDCAALAEEFGTPLFVTSENQFRDNYRRMKAAFTAAYPENAINVMWAVKSNTTMALRRIMNQEGAGGDCFSAGEVYATFMTAGDPDKMLLNGSNRSEEAFRMALECGMRITLDHLDDLFAVERLARTLGRPARVLIRVKCDLNSLAGVMSTFAPGIPLPLEVKSLKFGVTYDEAVEIVRQAAAFPDLIVEGLHSHIGRDVHLPEHWRGYARDMIDMAARLRDDTGLTVPIIDLGGGLSEIRDPSGNDLTRLAAPVEDYVREICAGLREGCQAHRFPLPRLWIEPGRHLVGSTTVLISRVGTVKRSPGLGTWIHVDASINHLQAIEHFNGMSYHLIPGTRARAKAEETVDVVGPNCAGDLIQLRRRLPKFQRGDLLVMLDVGAYNLSYANQFNCIPRPAAVLVNQSKVAVIRERESITDVFARHRMPDWLLGNIS
jgi:diaminopimelate decarboxylase